VSQGITRKSHYVPQDYLRGWSDDGVHVNAYRLLVPRPDYPVWRTHPIGGLLYFTDLYTSQRDGADSDEFERWLNEEIETPASGAFALARNGGQLAEDDWAKLALYLAALDLRTPTRYAELSEWWAARLPEIMDRRLKRAVRAAERARARGKPLVAPLPSAEARALPLRVTTERVPEGGGFLKAELTVGRELWLGSMRSLLTGVANRLRKHRWTILQPFGDAEWFTSDHPVVRLNFHSADDYNFGGGWDQRSGEILLPLSPRHLMYTKIGDPRPMSGVLPREHTLMLQRIIAERASRWIIARGRPVRAEFFRKRHVELEMFRREEDARESWHAQQSAAEGWEPD
jgi:hypothetical protein